MLNFLDPPVDSNTATSVGSGDGGDTRHAIARGDSGSEDCIRGGPRPPAEGKALYSVRIVAGKFAGVE